MKDGKRSRDLASTTRGLESLEIDNVWIDDINRWPEFENTTMSTTVPPLAFTTEGFASQLKGTKLSEVTTYFYAFTKLEF